MLKLILVLTVILLNSQHNYALLPVDLTAVTLLPGEDYRCCSDDLSREPPTIYCYYGTRKSLTNIWQTVSAFVDMTKPEKYEIYEGADEADVWTQYESSQSTWGVNIFNWGRKSVVLNPFNTTCLGIRTTKNYIIKLTVIKVNNILVGMFVLGAFLFFLAPHLVHNQLFYYLAGVTIGVFASVLVLLYLIVTLLPLKKPAMIGMMAGGSTVILYFFQYFVNNVLRMMPLYPKLVYGYLAVSGFISFVVCYRFGPLSNPRSKNLIQWSLQFVSLMLVFFSSYNQEVSLLLCALIAFLYKFPVSKWTTSVAHRMVKETTSLAPKHSTNPTKVANTAPLTNRLKRKLRFLSQQEYQEQGRVETERGLEEIRNFLRDSSEKWKAVRKIDPKNWGRFAKFLHGGPDVSRAEVEARFVEEVLTEEEDE